MFLTEHGLHFAKEGDHWRCVEQPDLLMLPGERYGVTERTFGSLDEALRHLEARGQTNTSGSTAQRSQHGQFVAAMLPRSIIGRR